MNVILNKTTCHKVKLDEGDGLSLIIDHRGITPKKLGGSWSNTGIPALSAKNIKDGQIINPKDIRYIDQKLYDRWMPEKLEKGDILLTSEAPLGEMFYLKSKVDYCLSQRLFALRSNPGVLDSQYLYYFLKSAMGQHELMRRISGTAAQGIRQAELRKVEISAPFDVQEQRRIVSILSSFDNKIELNNKINKNLELIAHMIFKEWFVNFKFPGYEKVKMIDSELGKIPEGWEMKELGDVADVQWGDTSITKSSYIEKGYPAYSASGQDGFREIYDFNRTGVVLSAIGANCGTTWLARNKWSAIKNTIRFWSVGDKISTEYLFLATTRKETWPQRGSAQPFIALGDARKRKILVPVENILKQFNNFIVGVYSKIDTIRLENQKLTALRDLLLPKLMSGEIRI